MRVIEAESLTKTYGRLNAVDNLSLMVEAGEVYGFVGLNGAGKTTAIRMFLGMIKPTQGKVLLFGRQVKSGDPLLNDIGYMVETPRSYPDLTVAENLALYQHYRRLKDGNLVGAVIDRLSLSRYRDVKEKHLSLGNKQRLGLAKALFHKPRLLILDEPTNGLDPAGIAEIRTLLKNLSSDGCTIFVSSHILGEISRLATRIGVLHEGRLIREIEKHKLEIDTAKKLVIKTPDNARAHQVLSQVWNTFLVDDDNGILHSTDPHAISSVQSIADKLVTSGIGVTEIFTEHEDIETYFLRIIKGNNL